MGLLTGGTSKLAGGFLGLGSNKGVAKPSFKENDFPDGLLIVEIKNGVELKADQIQLVGRFAPHIPFTFGGKMEMSKEYYPGNSEPTVQIIGSRENDLRIKGRLKTNKFKSDAPALRDAAVEYQELIDAMRLRGHLVRITLGEWKRYGFIEEVTFHMNRLQDIEYEINFFIVGFNPPTLDKATKGDGKVTAPNKEITALAAQALLDARAYPDSMPQSLQDEINDLIGDLAEKINLVTNFIDGIASDVEGLVNSANRAIGLIKNARANISRTGRRLGNLYNSAVGIPGSAVSEAQKTVSTIKNVSHINTIKRDYSSLAAFLASLQASFRGMARLVAKVRHLVRSGDTLQTVSMKYYANADLWKRIYDHNKLTSTTLVVGTVLEIPNL